MLKEIRWPRPSSSYCPSFSGVRWVAREGMYGKNTHFSKCILCNFVHLSGLDVNSLQKQIYTCKTNNMASNWDTRHLYLYFVKYKAYEKMFRLTFSDLPGREADHLFPSSVEVKECVELYLHFPNTPPWRGAWWSTGTNLPYLTFSNLNETYTWRYEWMFCRVNYF
jgi:hypothetical protein